VLAIAVLVPETALLVPGAAGRAVVLPEVRAAALDVIGELVRSAPDRVVVVAPGPVDRDVDAPGRASLSAAGIDDDALGWSGSQGVPDGALPAIGASVALLLLAHAGWTGPVTVVEVAVPRAQDDGRGEALRTRGADLVGGPDRVALVVAGSLSARDGAHAPQAEDARAAGFDARVLADLALGDGPARGRLAQLTAGLAAELVVTAWAPVQVLLGAAGDTPVEAEVLEVSAPYGVPYVVARWRVLPRHLPTGGRR
jgi:hypothetical protein